MIDALVQMIADQVGTRGAEILGVFLRVGAVVALLPGFGEQVIPARVRLGVALAFALIVWPALPPRTDTAALPVYLASEVAIGLLLGAGLRLMVHALQIAGTIAAQSTSLAQFLGGAGADPQPAMAQVLMLAGITLALLAGLGNHEEFELHLRATVRTGATPADVAQVLQHVAIYAGIPRANSAMKLAKAVLAELEDGK